MENLVFPYFNFLGGGPVKKNTLYYIVVKWQMAKLKTRDERIDQYSNSIQIIEEEY